MKKCSGNSPGIISGNIYLQGGCLLLCIFLSLCAFPAAASSANNMAGQVSSNSTAVQVVEGLHAILLKSMKKGSSLSCRERYKLMEPFILKSFDFPLISRIVLGHYWRSMDDAERQEFLTAFSSMTVATYASRFDSYSGEQFKTIDSKIDDRGHYRVDTVLIKKDGDEISLSYTCRKVDDHWKIVGVAARGVNDLSLKRADYSSFLKKHSIADLISKLREQARKCK